MGMETETYEREQKQINWTVVFVCLLVGTGLAFIAVSKASMTYGGKKVCANHNSTLVEGFKCLSMEEPNQNPMFTGFPSG